MIGTLLANRYRIDAPLGEGGMGVVYRAHDTVLDRPVAIKTVSSQGLGAEGLKRLILEARAAAQLNHPNVVAIHDVLQQDGEAPHIVMELVEGKTLRDLIPMPWPGAVATMRDVFAAMAFAHGRGIIHRDLKPDNIIVTAAGVPKVMDFGLARSEGRSRLTQAGMLLGTVAYMAPEQVLRGEADARSDLYSLGCVLYEVVTGRAPFTGEDPIAVISQHLQIPPVAPHWYNAEIPPELEGIILKLMAKDPAERFASASDVIVALDQLTAAPVSTGVEAAAISPALLLGTVLRTRLVARDAELRELKSSVELAASGHGQVVMIEGEPGIGKTRLLQEAQVYARLRGFAVLVGRCYEQESAVPYLPFIELFQGRFRDMPHDELAGELGHVAPEFVKIIPEVRERLPEVEPSVPLEPVQERLRLFSSVARYLTNLARRTPIVLVLEDLHWADAASLSLLQMLARTLRGERVLMLGSYRDVEVDRRHPLGDVLREMNRERLFNLVNLRRLQPEGVRAMVQTMFEVQQVSDEFLGVLYDETEGNPFFVEEVLKSLVEEGAIYREDARWQRKEIAEIQVPKSIREVVGRRLERVSETCQRALSVGAVIGRRFRFETVEAVGDLGEEELLNAIEEATRAQLIREETQAGSVEYDFAHALIREVLYERLSARRRMTFHQKVGEALEHEYADRTDAVVEDLAHHFMEAPHGENLRKAIEYSIRAAEKAMRLFAYEEAVRFYENAADFLKELGDEARLAEVQQAGAEPFSHLDQADAALAWYQSALAFYERVRRPVEAARVHRLMGRVLQRHRRYNAAVPHLETALQGLDAEHHPEDVIPAHLDLARALSFLGDMEAAERHAETALRLATDRGSLAMQAEAHVSLGFVLYNHLDLDGAQRHNDEAIRLAHAAGEREAGFTLFRALRNKGVVLGNRGARREALDLYLEQLAVCERLRDVGLLANCHLNLAAHFWFIGGDGVRARFHLQQAFELPLSPSHRENAELFTHLFQGDWEGALAVREAAWKKIRETGEIQVIYIDRITTAGLLLDLDRDQDAYGEASEAAAMAENKPILLVQYWGSVITLARALSRGGDWERAENLIRLTKEGAERAGSMSARTSALVARGALALERNDPEAAVSALDEAPLETGSAWMSTWRLRFHTEALARRNALGDLERAREAWDACRALLEQMMDHRRIKLFEEQLAPLLAS
jgi:tetratricopeptide (TPR) repeat protein